MSRTLFLVLLLLAFTAGNVQASVTLAPGQDATRIEIWHVQEEPAADPTPGNSNGNPGGNNSGNNSGSNQGGGGGGFSFDPLGWFKPENISKALGDVIGGILITPVQDAIHQQLMGFPCGNIVTYTDPKCTTEWDVLKPFIDKALGAPLFFVIWTAYISQLFEGPKRKRSALERAQYHHELQWFFIAFLLAWSVRDTLGPGAILAVNFMNAQIPEPDMGALISFGGVPTVSDNLFASMFPPAAALLNLLVYGLDLIFVAILYGVIILRWFAIDMGLVFAGPILAFLAHKRIRIKVETIIYAYLGILFCQPFYKFGLALLIDMRKAFPASQALAGGVILLAGIWVIINLIWYSKSFLQEFPQGDRFAMAASMLRRRRAA